MKVPFILSLLFIVNISFGQTDAELTVFAEIYDIKTNFNRSLHLNAFNILEEEGVNMKTYTELLKLKLEAKDVPKDPALIKALKRVNSKQTKLKEELLIAECQKRNFDIKLYLELEKRYKTDFKFNKQASPFILAAKRK